MNETNLPTLATWSARRLRRALVQIEELIVAAGDYLPVDDWRITHRDELRLALEARRVRRDA